MEVLFLDTLLKYRFLCIEVIAGRKKRRKERKKQKVKKYNIFIFLYYCTALLYNYYTFRFAILLINALNSGNVVA